MVLFISALFKLLPRENAIQDIDPRDRLVLFSCFSLMFSFYFIFLWPGVCQMRCIRIIVIIIIIITSVLLLMLFNLQKSLCCCGYHHGSIKVL